MDSTISVAKGVFVFKNGFKSAKDARTRRKVAPQTGELWQQAYSSLWNTIEKKIETLNQEMYTKVSASLLDFIKDSYMEQVNEIPTAALLTGINMPDHGVQFTALAKKIRQDITPHVALLYSQDCQSMKYLVENMMGQLVDKNVDAEFEEFESAKIFKSRCNFSVLQAWYENEYKAPFNIKNNQSRAIRSLHKHKVLVVIIPDFESFADRILQQFILIASTYINVLPFVFIFGIATSLMVLHKALPYHVSSKVNIQVFNSKPSVGYLNDVLEHVLLSDDCPFHLGGRVFNLFTDIFLFYDFSVTGFVQKFKFAMFEHFSLGNARALCTKRSRIADVAAKFTHKDCEDVRRLPSFRNFVENSAPAEQIKLLTDDEHLKVIIKEEAEKILKFLNVFHAFLKCLYILVKDLPNTPLGKHLRELYAEAASKKITATSGYQECFQLLGFQSKDELMKKATKMCQLLEDEAESTRINRNQLDEIVDQLSVLIEEMDAACLNAVNTDEQVDDLNFGGDLDRKLLKQRLLENTKRKRPPSQYEAVRKKFLDYVSSLFEKHLPDPKSIDLHEIFFFDDVSVESRVVGSHRAAIHTALTDPHFYLQCVCCKLPNDGTILRTMPDICVAYKLHLEHGRMINLYDWLQAFAAVIDNQQEGEDDDEIDPKLHARFTLAVAELEFLGFIKSSKRQPDYVQRLTWGGK